MAATITGIASMATRQLLSDVSARYRAATGRTVGIEATGGVDAARRVRAGEGFDVILLADNVIEALEAEGHLVAGSRVAFARSPMAMAVRAGTARPAIDSAAAVQGALMGARSIGYSTGPSGVHLEGVLKGWGIDAAATPGRLVQAKPGVPVASLVASGEVAVGVQQLSELLGVRGIEIVGVLPEPVQSVTVFSAGVGARSAQAEAARDFLGFLNAAEAVAVKRRFGMEPA